jgi:hypothetical protein
MIIMLGKNEPTDIEKALMKAVGLGDVKINASKEYYLEKPLGTMTGGTLVPKYTAPHQGNNTIIFNKKPIIHQKFNASGNIESFTLDINGMCQCMDSDWHSEASVQARKTKHDDAIITSKVQLHIQLIHDLVDFEKNMNTIKHLQAAFIYRKIPTRYLNSMELPNTELETKNWGDYKLFSEALNNTRSLNAKLQTFKHKHPDIYQMHVVDDEQKTTLKYVDHSKTTLEIPLFKRTHPPSLQGLSSAEAMTNKLWLIEKEKLDANNKNQFDPEHIPVPPKIKAAIIELINTRRNEIKDTWWLLFCPDKSRSKASALDNLIMHINQKDYSSSELKEFIATWNKSGRGHGINDSRSRMDRFKTTLTTTQKMINNIQDTLGDTEQSTRKPPQK